MESPASIADPVDAAAMHRVVGAVRRRMAAAAIWRNLALGTGFGAALTVALLDSWAMAVRGNVACYYIDACMVAAALAAGVAFRARAKAGDQSVPGPREWLAISVGIGTCGVGAAFLQLCGALTLLGAPELAAAAMAVGIASFYFAARGVPPEAAAALIDRRFATHDAVATAWELTNQGHEKSGAAGENPKPRLEFKDAIVRRASEACESLDPASIPPPAMHSRWYIPVILSLLGAAGVYWRVGGVAERGLAPAAAPQKTAGKPPERTVVASVHAGPAKVAPIHRAKTVGDHSPAHHREGGGGRPSRHSSTSGPSASIGHAKSRTHRGSASGLAAMTHALSKTAAGRKILAALHGLSIAKRGPGIGTPGAAASGRETAATIHKLQGILEHLPPGELRKMLGTLGRSNVPPSPASSIQKTRIGSVKFSVGQARRLATALVKQWKDAGKEADGSSKGRGTNSGIEIFGSVHGYQTRAGSGGKKAIPAISRRRKPRPTGPVRTTQIAPRTLVPRGGDVPAAYRAAVRRYFETH